MLVCTSLSFLLPAVKGLKGGKKMIPLIDTAASIASINHWRNPKDDLRFKIDKLCARTAFVSNGYLAIKDRNAVALRNGIRASVLFISAHICDIKRVGLWWVLHGAFHLSGARSMYALM